MSNRKVLCEVLNEIHKEYIDNLYDFMQNETHAQFELYSKLREKLKGKISIELKQDKLIPNQPMQGSIVRLEKWGEENKYDICLVKEGNYSKSDDFETETIIEIKIGYSYRKAQFDATGINKDYEILRKNNIEGSSREAFLVYFLGNSFNEQKNKLKDGQSHIEIYKEALGEGIKEERISKNNVFIVFTDCIKNGKMEDAVLS